MGGQGCTGHGGKVVKEVMAEGEFVGVVRQKESSLLGNGFEECNWRARAKGEWHSVFRRVHELNSEGLSNSKCSGRKEWRP